jgi:hypothetical protein
VSSAYSQSDPETMGGKGIRGIVGSSGTGSQTQMARRGLEIPERLSGKRPTYL